MVKRAFRASGSFLNLGTNTRQLVFQRELRRPAEDLILFQMGVFGQPTASQDVMLWEVLVNGRTIHAEEIVTGTRVFKVNLPYPRFGALGLLQAFVTNNAVGILSDVGIQLEGFYVRRA